ncbi:hypothetical protein ACQJ6X_02655 [Helicobacter pylori]
MIEANIMTKNDPKDAMKIKKGSKNNKNPSQSKSLEKEIEDYFFCLRFH